MSIRIKFILTFVILVLFISSGYVASVALYLTDNLKTELVNRMILNSKHQAEELSDMVAANDTESIVEYIFDEKYARSDLAYSIVLDENNQPLASTLINDNLHSKNVRNLPREAKEYIEEIRDQNGNSIYNVYVRMGYDNGVLLNGYYGDQINRSIENVVYIMAVTMMVAIVVTILIVWIISKFAFRPFNSLKDTVKKIASGNLDERVHINTKDEIGYFAQIFNQMLDNLQQFQKAEISLQESNFLNFLEVVPLCIQVLDDKGKLSFINKFGKKEHFLDQNIDVKNWDWLATLKKPYQKKMLKCIKDGLNGISSSIEVEHNSEGANCSWCLSIVSPVKNRENKIISVLIISEDISSIKNSEMESAKNVNMFRSLIDSVPLCIKFFDQEGNLILVNKHGQEDHYLEDKNEEQIKKWDYLGCVDEQYREGVKKALEAAFKGEVTKMEIKHLTGTTKTEWAYSTFMPIRDYSGKIVNVLYISRDTSEEKALEEERERSFRKIDETKNALYSILEDVKDSERKLQQERDQSKAIISSMGEGLMLVGSDFKIAMINNKGAEIFNVTPDQLIGTDIRETVLLFKGDVEMRDKDRAVITMFNTGESNHKTLNDNYFYYCPISKKKFPVDLSATPLIQKGKVMGVIIVFKDVSQLKELDEAKDSFISIASHQLRTPVTSIRWYAEMLNSGDAGKLEKSQAEFVDRIYTSALKLSETINMLLSLARVESGKAKMDSLNIDLRSITQEILKEMEPEIKIKNINVNVNIEKIRKLEGDAAMLRQVITNLVSNSLRYTEYKGYIEITAKVNKKEVQYSVKDDGIGIPEKEKEKLFNKFYRAENAVAKVPSGSGLGLVLVKTLVELWHGKITFESPAIWIGKNGVKVKKGTEFVFTIPINK